MGVEGGAIEQICHLLSTLFRKKSRSQKKYFPSQKPSPSRESLGNPSEIRPQDAGADGEGELLNELAIFSPSFIDYDWKKFRSIEQISCS